MFLASTKLFFVVSTLLVESYYKNIRLGAPHIAEKFNVNKRTLSVIFNRLMRTGILQSQTGGSNAGFILTRDPRTISIADITIALEGEIHMESYREVCPDSTCLQLTCDNCILKKVADEAAEALYAKLSSLSLYELYQSALENDKAVIQAATFDI